VATSSSHGFVGTLVFEDAIDGVVGGSPHPHRNSVRMMSVGAVPFMAVVLRLLLACIDQQFEQGQAERGSD
jgi:hypothetical protein